MVHVYVCLQLNYMCVQTFVDTLLPNGTTNNIDMFLLDAVCSIPGWRSRWRSP